MMFPYWTANRGGDVRFLPMVEVSVHGPAGSRELVALVDSGAEHCVLGFDVSDRLKISLMDAEHVIVIGAGGHDLDGYKTAVDLQLGRRRWQAPVLFSQAGARRAILGQIGVFAFFAVTFRYAKREIEIRRNR